MIIFNTIIFSFTSGDYCIIYWDDCTWIRFDNFTKSGVYDDNDSLKQSSVCISVLNYGLSKYEKADSHGYVDPKQK